MEISLVLRPIELVSTYYEESVITIHLFPSQFHQALLRSKRPLFVANAHAYHFICNIHLIFNNHSLISSQFHNNQTATTDKCLCQLFASQKLDGVVRRMIMDGNMFVNSLDNTSCLNSETVVTTHRRVILQHPLVQLPSLFWCTFQGFHCNNLRWFTLPVTQVSTVHHTKFTCKLKLP